MAPPPLSTAAGSHTITHVWGKKNKKTGLTGREGDYSWVATIVTRPEPRAGGRTPTHQPAANSDMQHATSPHRAAQVNECRCIQGVVSNGPGERWGLMSVSVLPNIIDFETQGVKNNQMWYIFLNIYKWSDSRVGSFLIQSTVTDQLEFISQVKSGIFLVKKQTINLLRLKPAGERLTRQRQIWSGTDCPSFDL